MKRITYKNNGRKFANADGEIIFSLHVWEGYTKRGFERRFYFHNVNGDTVAYLIDDVKHTPLDDMELSAKAFITGGDEYETEKWDGNWETDYVRMKGIDTDGKIEAAIRMAVEHNNFWYTIGR